MRLARYDFLTDLTDGKRTFANGMPRFIVQAERLKYEEFASLPDYDRWRWMVFSAYRITDKRPFYLGVVINSGEGLDEFAVTASYGLQLERLVEFF